MFSNFIIGTPVPGEVKSLSFDDYKKKKDNKRRSKFKKANTKDTKRSAAQKSTNEVAKVQVGLVTSSPDLDHLKKVKGRTIPVPTEPIKCHPNVHSYFQFLRLFSRLD